jgi:hypothetical protein
MPTIVAQGIVEKNFIQHIQHKDLLTLARFEGERAQAVSFYFSGPSFSDKSHHEQLTAIRHLGRSIVSSHLEHFPRSHELLADLDAILESAEEMQEGPTGFKAIFACRQEGIWQEFDLPIRAQIQAIKTGSFFYLVPLLRAMELCRPYAVVLVEHGKARGFVVRGTSIQEIPGFLPQRNLHLHVDDSRVGWSHHIEGDQQQQAQAYLHELSREIQRFLVTQGCSDLIIGCREDLWSEMGHYLVNQTSTSLRGQFHLPSFDASADDILRAAKPVFDVYQQKRHARLLGTVHERSGCGAEGIPAVLQELEEGRVHTLLLGPPSDAEILKCGRCGLVVADGVHTCPFCSNGELEAANAQEVLVRKALLTGAEIVPIDTLDASVAGDVAALLRY